jgi:arginyl-tRNA synthetase
MRDEIATNVATVIAKLFDVQVGVELTRPDEQFGDYATNIAMQLTKQLGRNPREIADEIAVALGESSNAIRSVEVAGPGFLNITLTDAVLQTQATTKPAALRSDTVVIETNNPNPFKAMHIGHGYNAILGDTIANLIEQAGAATYRVSYHGDVGLHVGKSMYALLEYVGDDPAKLDEVPTSEHNAFMSRMYATGSRAYADDPEAKVEIDELTKQSFTREDPLYARVYETCKEWSFAGIDEMVALLGNKPIKQRFLESDADARGVAIVRKNTPNVFMESDGALVFPGSKYGSFDNAYVTSRGLGLYGARDLGLMQLKNEQYHPDKSYIITGGEQAAYFKGVITASGLIWPEMKDVTVNIPTGLVKLSTGKMSSRDGDVLEVEWLFDQFRNAITARGGEPHDDLIAGAMRYQFLKVKIGGDVVFDVSEAVSLSGNTGSYLQYAHARARSILAKSAGDTSLDSPEFEADERTLLRKIGEYSEVAAHAMTELLPHHVCTYLYELAQEFNRFYEHNRVLGDPREGVRLWLVDRYAETLKQGLELLGIVAPERM